MAHGRRTILMVEDESSITAPLIEALEREGFESAVARTAAEGMSLAGDLSPDLVLLDVGLPDGSGYDVCRELRRSSEVPIIMLSARGEETDRIVGLEVGADDYVVKPFSARELVARIRAVLRRSRPTEAAAGDEPLEVGDVQLDQARHEVTHAGELLELTRKEFDLLRLLMRNAGAVVSREQLIEDVWDANWFGPTKTLDVHVSALRKKLGDDPAAPRYVHTVRGVGFRFAAGSELAPGETA
jgi:two-component system, OmpR family, response regulator RegX3